MRVLWSEEARRDLRDIYRYRSRFSVESARSLLRAIRSRALQLEQFPDSGRQIPDTSNRYIRELIEGDYRIMYQRFADRIEIFAVIHGRVAFQEPERDP